MYTAAGKGRFKHFPGSSGIIFGYLNCAIQTDRHACAATLAPDLIYKGPGALIRFQKTAGLKRACDNTITAPAADFGVNGGQSGRRTGDTTLRGR